MSSKDPRNRPLDECLQYLNTLPEYRRVVEALVQQSLDAVDELGDLVDLVDEATAAAIVEETARDLFRQRYPWVSAATVHTLVEG